MAERCETAAVLGAGVMGAGIAAHFAGAGIRTHLLDIVPRDAGEGERNRLAEMGIKNALKSKPPAFYDPDAARLITAGNLDDHLDRLAECDLVVEAVVERMDIKKALLARVAEKVGPSTIVASNTSGLSIADIGADLPDDVARRLVVMHFFNPVRYMRLLELVAGPKTDPAVVARVARIGEDLGKGIVYGKDTPNFVANRIGTHAFGVAMEAMAEAGLKIEEVDKIVGVPMGRPKTAVFGLADLVGIDTMLHVLQTCYDALPDDEDRDAFSAPDWMRKMVEAGKTGRKAKAGFFKKVGKDLLVIDPETLEYREQVKVRYESIGATRRIDDPAERLAAYVYADDAAGQFAWKTLARSLCYTARRVGEIADDIVNIDRAMRWGFNWDLGPFEAWDAIGVRKSVERMHQDGLDVPAWVDAMVESGQESFYSGPEAEKRYFDVGSSKPVALPQDPHHIRLAALHDHKKLVVKENLGASLVDLGDGCLCLEVHTKMNTIDDDVVAMLGEAVDEAEKNFEALVIGNDGEHFGAGANVMLVVMAAKQKQWDKIDGIVKALQDAIQKARYARVPVVAAPFGYTFGGCAEIAMGANAIQAHAETYIGQVEVGMGLIPAGGGCLRLVERWTSDVTKVANLDLLHLLADPFMSIATAQVAAGAEEGKRHRFLLPSDGITLNRDHLLHHAKQRALGMARAGYRPARPQLLRAAGLDTAKTLGLQAWGMAEAGWATEYEAHLAKKIAHVLCGGNVAANTEVDERHYLELEREAFVSLCGEEKTQERIEHFLTKGKPLRN